MCVIFLAFQVHPDHPLILLANRDEYYDRPTLAADHWSDHPNIFGGRDLRGGGTWLGVTEGGRFAAVTNYRDPSAPAGIRSRGDLVVDFLTGDLSPESYLLDIEKARHRFSGFNLLVGDISPKRQEIYYYSNRGLAPRRLGSGIYGLSNHLLDTPWPKVTKGKGKFSSLLFSGVAIDREKFFEILSNEELADNNVLPSTGVPYEIEKAISPIFIKTAGYGTRCSTVLEFGRNFEWNFEERVFV